MRVMSSGDGDRTAGNLRRGGGCMTLNRDDSVRGLECSRGLECYSPARVAVCRLLAVVRKCKGRRREKPAVAKEVERQRPDNASDQLQPITTKGCDNSVSGLERQEMTFNVAAGLGLLSLIAASKTELTKTVELRRQMEMFLNNVVKVEHESEATTPKRSEPEVPYAVSMTMDGLSNLSPYSNEDHAPELSQQSGISFECVQHYDGHQTDECVDGLNHLEEELEAELERLQLDIETEEYREGENLSEDNQEEVTEMSNNNATGTVSDVSFGEVIDQREPVTPEHCGVPPLELERRLHELLETRQEERIKELEAHLEYMKKQLQEKEVEVSWWKDTAKIISKQVPETASRILRASGSLK